MADPKFIDPANHDFRLQPDSPALALGFVPIDYAQAGGYGDPAWVRKARKFQYPPCEYSPPRPPLTFSDDFEDTPVGETPALASVHAGEPPASIAVTEELAAGGRRPALPEDYRCARTEVCARSALLLLTASEPRAGDPGVRYPRRAGIAVVL